MSVDLRPESQSNLSVRGIDLSGLGGLLLPFQTGYFDQGISSQISSSFCKKKIVGVYVGKFDNFDLGTKSFHRMNWLRNYFTPLTLLCSARHAGATPYCATPPR